MQKVAVGLIIMVFSWLLVIGLPELGVAQYLGETTWTVTKTHDKHGVINPPKIFTLKGAITRMGGPYYTMQGYIDVSPDGPFILSGGGVLIGSTLFLTLSGSQKHVDTTRDTSIWHVELNHVSLNGSLFDVGHDFDTATEGPNPIFDSAFAEATLTRTGPSISLTSEVPLPLLLLDR